MSRRKLKIIFSFLLAICEIRKGQGKISRSHALLAEQSASALSKLPKDYLSELAARESYFYYSLNAKGSNFQNELSGGVTVQYIPSATVFHPSHSPSLSSVPTLAPSLSPTISNSPSSSPSQTQYPEAVIPEDAAQNGYYNYNPNDSEFGPGTPIFVPYVVNETFTYTRMTYLDNKWLQVKNSPEYFYWKDVIGDNLISNDVPNQCDTRFQSPVNVWANGATCFEDHSIRSFPGDFAMNEHAFIEKQILPNKLRFKYWRRPPGTEEPDPPTVDLPYGWSKLADLLHIDVRIPSEHLIEGKRYPAEYQLWYYYKPRKRIIALSIMMDIDPDDKQNEHWEKALLEMEVKFLADEIDCEMNRRRKLKSEQQWLRRMRNFIKAGVDSDSFNIIGSDAETDHESHSHSTILDEPEHVERSFQHLRRVVTERSENTLFDGKRPEINSDIQSKGIHPRKKSVKSDSMLRKRNLAKPKPPQANSERWDPLHEDLRRSQHFYGYYGSLTEPPCTEIVSWRIFDKPALISKDQLRRMKDTLFNHVDGSCRRTSSHYKSGAARPIQDQMGRPIWHCTSENF